MKKFLFIVFILIFFVNCKKTSKYDVSGVKRNDSLAFFFDFANNTNLPIKQRYLYTTKALALISSEGNDSMNRVNYFKIANRYFNIKYLEDYKKITKKIVTNAIVSKDSISLAKAYSYLADYYGSKFVSDSAYYYNYENEKIYRRLKDNLNVAKSLLNKAVLQHNESDFLNCEKTVFEALKLLRSTDDYEMIYQAYNLLGITYGELTEYDLSKLYYTKALEIANKNIISPEYHSKAVTLNNLGMLYRHQNNDYEALKFYKLGIKEANLFKDEPTIYAMLLDNLAYSKFKTGDFNNLPNLFFESLKIRDSLKNIPGIVLNNIHISEYYATKKDTIKAFSYAKEAYNVAHSNKEKRDLLPVLQQLSNVNPKKALKYSAEYYKLNDSLKVADHKMQNKFARIEFETDEIITQKNQLEEQRKTLVYITLGIIILATLIFVIRFQAAKNRELKLVQEQQKANEEIYQLMLNQQNKIEEVRQSEKKRIAQELHDGVLGKLFGTRMNLGVLNRKRDEQAEAERDVYIDELKTLEQEIREISHDLNSEKTAVFNNFVLMVTNFIETQKKVCKANIGFSVDPDIEWNTVENMAKINLYRILQEAFQNINKHANAENVTVTFAGENGLIKLNVRDDGVGFNYAKKKKGIGLLNMNARITDSQGNMHIETEPGKGTELKFELPINPT